MEVDELIMGEAAKTNSNPLAAIRSFGQSVWLDYLGRELIDSGGLRRLIEDDGVSGVTSNPAIFERAIAGGSAYDAVIARLTSEGKDPATIYRHLTLGDVAAAADLLRPLHEVTAGADGFVSLEVSPHLAYDSEGTVREARELWAALDRPNVLIKVPATRAGLPAVRRLVAEGINVNVTLLFGLARYREVAEAYLAGLEARLQAKRSLRGVASVASFFLSRIDTLVDSLLEEIAKRGGPDTTKAARLEGEAAVASAKLAYRDYQAIFSDKRFRSLADRGARPQRLLWASTSTKNPAYPDTKYVEPLIGPDTVNTMPLETLDAYRDHGRPAATLSADVGRAEAVLAGLREVGIGIDAIAQQLEEEGVQKFVEPYDKLLASIERKAHGSRRAKATDATG